MTEEDCSRRVVNHLLAEGYQLPSEHMRKRVEAALGVTVPLWFRAPPWRKQEMLMMMHKALVAADAIVGDREDEEHG